MKTFGAPGNVLTFTAPSPGVVSGVPVLIGGLLVVPQTTAATGAQFAGVCDGAFIGMPKATSQVWAEGAVLYWDNTAKNFTTTSTANFRVGCAGTNGALSADTVGPVRLNGVAVTAVGGVAP